MAPVIMICFVALVYQYKWMKENKFRYGSNFAVERIPCGHCARTGLVPSREYETGITFCPQCLGLGGHYIKRIDDYDALCPACGGMGRVEDLETGKFRYCRRCNGRGLIRSAHPLPNKHLKEVREQPKTQE
jgi:DnaJ-class molecular chaperone